ncbi:LbetaH domain-containing protein [Oenococcus oeni]|uniref:hypothetical protein n=1 Tax=Oenococcus oeni TaxID=1247 RepID=UPI0010B71B2D|nr:hypothetical protein [Oenococcus oeni]SYW14876.1 Serine O-acetyltransferase [Oenococcus oeni]
MERENMALPTKIIDKRTYKYFVPCDDAARGTKKHPLPLRDSEQRFQRILRKTEYRWNTRKKSPIHLVLAILAKIRYAMLYHFYNVQIPLNVFGPGLIIWHLQGITVNHGAHVGRNFSISKGCTIGHRNWVVPTIGDNCEMCINSSILGEGIQAQGVVIGAHALVIKPITQSNSIWAGVPAVKIHDGISDAYQDRFDRVGKIKF